VTLLDQAQELATAQDRPWWVVTDRTGRQRITPSLAEAVNHCGLLKVLPVADLSLDQYNSMVQS
jgi:hypothetical protein